MDFSLGKDIIITDYTRAVLDWCREHLVFANPDYLKKEAMGKWTGNTQRNIVLFELVGNKLIVPFGVDDVAHRFPRGKNDVYAERLQVPQAVYQLKLHILIVCLRGHALVLALTAEV